MDGHCVNSGQPELFVKLVDGVQLLHLEHNVYQMSGNQISVKTLDLNQDFSEIAAQLKAIVDTHFE